jgi:hypothetical protein
MISSCGKWCFLSSWFSFKLITLLGSPALIMLLTGRRLLPHSPRWNLGHFAYPICAVAVGYSLLVLSVAFVWYPLSEISVQVADLN